MILITSATKIRNSNKVNHSSLLCSIFITGYFDIFLKYVGSVSSEMFRTVIILSPCYACCMGLHTAQLFVLQHLEAPSSVSGNKHHLFCTLSTSVCLVVDRCRVIHEYSAQRQRAWHYRQAFDPRFKEVAVCGPARDAP